MPHSARTPDEQTPQTRLLLTRLSLALDRRGLYVENLSEWVVRRPSEVQQLLRRGSAVRATGATRANEASSRSHAVFIIVLEQSEAVGADEQRFRVGKLNLVDLAGSERARASGAIGQRLEECKRINASLSALGTVLAAFTAYYEVFTAHYVRTYLLTYLLTYSRTYSSPGNVIAALTDTRGRSKPSHHVPHSDSKLLAASTPLHPCTPSPLHACAPACCDA